MIWLEFELTYIEDVIHNSTMIPRLRFQSFFFLSANRLDKSITAVRDWEGLILSREVS